MITIDKCVAVLELIKNGIIIKADDLNELEQIMLFWLSANKKMLLLSSYVIHINIR